MVLFKLEPETNLYKLEMNSLSTKQHNLLCSRLLQPNTITTYKTTESNCFKQYIELNIITFIF